MNIKAFKSYVYYRHTDIYMPPKLYTTPLHGWSLEAGIIALCTLRIWYSRVHLTLRTQHCTFYFHLNLRLRTALINEPVKFAKSSITRPRLAQLY